MAIKPKDADEDSSVFRLSSSQVSRRLKRMCEEAGIDSKDISGFTPRATLSRVMNEKGVSTDDMRAQLRMKPADPSWVYMETDDGIKVARGCAYEG